MSKSKRQFNCRLDADTVELIDRLSAALPGSQADVVTRAVRLLARRELPAAKPAKNNSEKSAKTA